MAQSDCDRLDAILDRVVGDEGALRSEDMAFLAKHPLTCPSCALSIGLYEEMVRLDVAGQPATTDGEDWLDTVVVAAQERRTTGRFLRAGGLTSAAAVIVLVVVPAAALIVLATVVWPERLDDPRDRALSTDRDTNVVNTDVDAHTIEPAQRDNTGQALPDTAADDAVPPVEPADRTRVARVDDQGVGEADPGPGLPDGSAADRPAISTLLAEARQRRAGQDWHGEAAAYQLLIETHPESSEATLCLVPLGQVQLEQLDQPELALASFRGYVHNAPAGLLLEEAQWGEAEALYQLGRGDEARDALQRFLDHHPGSLYAPRAIERLESGGER